MQNTHEKLKCVVVGDSAVGKTSLLLRYTSTRFLDKYIPTAFDNFEAKIVIDSREITLNLHDTAGEDGYEKLRCLSYENADIIFICFSMANRTSFQNVKEKWYPEVVRNVRKQVPIVLVGLKLDLRDEKLNKKNRRSSFVSYSQGLALSKKLNARAYYECSSLEQIGVSNLFQTSIKLVMINRQTKTINGRFYFKKFFCFST